MVVGCEKDKRQSQACVFIVDVVIVDVVIVDVVIVDIVIVDVVNADLVNVDSKRALLGGHGPAGGVVGVGVVVVGVVVVVGIVLPSYTSSSVKQRQFVSCWYLVIFTYLPVIG